MRMIRRGPPGMRTKQEKAPKGRRGRRWLGNLLIAAGVLMILYCVWLNYAGRLYQWAFGKYYDSLADAGQDLPEDFFSYEDIPQILLIGQALLPNNAEAPVAGDAEEEAPAQEDEAAEPEAEKQPEPEPESPWQIDYSARSDYNNGDMTLVVPRMGLRARVVDGTSTAQLKRGPGLYVESDLPTDEGGRVLIAAHRDVFGAWFYRIDKMKPGDQMKVIFGDQVYVYEYVDTVVVEKNDWSVTKPRDYTSLILTSCTPKGTSKQRIVVTGKLVNIEPRS